MYSCKQAQVTLEGIRGTVMGEVMWNQACDDGHTPVGSSGRYQEIGKSVSQVRSRTVPDFEK